MTDKFVRNVEKFIQDDRRLTVDKLYETCPEVSHTVLYETITVRLKFRKPYTRWVPKMLTDDHKANRVRSPSVFLDRHE